MMTVGLSLVGVAPTQAARLVPAIVTDTFQTTTSVPRGSVGNAFVYQDGVYVGGEAGDWRLGDYRLSGDMVDATMTARFSNGSYRVRTSAAAKDINVSDLYPAESNPEVRQTWFYIQAQAGDFLGQPKTLNLALNWQSNQTRGAEPVATLTNLAGQRISTLTSRGDRESPTVLVGGYYRLDITHPTQVKNGTILSAAAFDASLQPLPTILAPAAIVPGDYNLDGSVDAADYSVWRDGMKKPYNFNLDGDGSGSIDQGDYEVWAHWFGTSAPASSVATPEPTALALGLLMVGGAATRRRPA